MPKTKTKGKGKGAAAANNRLFKQRESGCGAPKTNCALLTCPHSTQAGLSWPQPGRWPESAQEAWEAMSVEECNLIVTLEVVKLKERAAELDSAGHARPGTTHVEQLEDLLAALVRHGTTRTWPGPAGARFSCEEAFLTDLRARHLSAAVRRALPGVCNAPATKGAASVLKQLEDLEVHLKNHHMLLYVTSDQRYIQYINEIIVGLTAIDPLLCSWILSPVQSAVAHASYQELLVAMASLSHEELVHACAWLAGRVSDACMYQDRNGRMLSRQAQDISRWELLEGGRHLVPSTAWMQHLRLGSGQECRQAGADRWWTWRPAFSDDHSSRTVADKLRSGIKMPFLGSASYELEEGAALLARGAELLTAWEEVRPQLDGVLRRCDTHAKEFCQAVAPALGVKHTSCDVTVAELLEVSQPISTAGGRGCFGGAGGGSEDSCTVADVATCASAPAVDDGAASGTGSSRVGVSTAAHWESSSIVGDSRAPALKTPLAGSTSSAQSIEIGSPICENSAGDSSLSACTSQGLAPGSGRFGTSDHRHGSSPASCNGPISSSASSGGGEPEQACALAAAAAVLWQDVEAVQAVYMQCYERLMRRLGQPFDPLLAGQVVAQGCSPSHIDATCAADCLSAMGQPVASDGSAATVPRSFDPACLAPTFPSCCETNSNSSHARMPEPPPSLHSPRECVRQDEPGADPSATLSRGTASTACAASRTGRVTGSAWGGWGASGASTAASRTADPRGRSLLDVLHQHSSASSSLSSLATQLRLSVSRRVAVLAILERQLADLACQDMGPTVEHTLLVPLLSARLEQAILARAAAADAAQCTAQNRYIEELLLWDDEQRQQADPGPAQRRRRRTTSDRKGGGSSFTQAPGQQACAQVGDSGGSSSAQGSQVRSERENGRVRAAAASGSLADSGERGHVAGCSDEAHPAPTAGMAVYPAVAAMPHALLSAGLTTTAETELSRPPAAPAMSSTGPGAEAAKLPSTAAAAHATQVAAAAAATTGKAQAAGAAEEAKHVEAVARAAGQLREALPSTSGLVSAHSGGAVGAGQPATPAAGASQVAPLAASQWPAGGGAGQGLPAGRATAAVVAAAAAVPPNTEGLTGVQAVETSRTRANTAVMAAATVPVAKVASAGRACAGPATTPAASREAAAAPAGVAAVVPGTPGLGHAPALTANAGRLLSQAGGDQHGFAAVATRSAAPAAATEAMTSPGPGASRLAAWHASLSRPSTRPAAAVSSPQVASDDVAALDPAAAVAPSHVDWAARAKRSWAAGAAVPAKSVVPLPHCTLLPPAAASSHCASAWPAPLRRDSAAAGSAQSFATPAPAVAAVQSAGHLHSSKPPAAAGSPAPVQGATNRGKQARSAAVQSGAQHCDLLLSAAASPLAPASSSRQPVVPVPCAFLPGTGHTNTDPASASTLVVDPLGARHGTGEGSPAAARPPVATLAIDAPWHIPPPADDPTGSLSHSDSLPRACPAGRPMHPSQEGVSPRAQQPLASSTAAPPPPQLAVQLRLPRRAAPLVLTHGAVPPAFDHRLAAPRANLTASSGSPTAPPDSHHGVQMHAGVQGRPPWRAHGGPGEGTEHCDCYSGAGDGTTSDHPPHHAGAAASEGAGGPSPTNAACAAHHDDPVQRSPSSLQAAKGGSGSSLAHGNRSASASHPTGSAAEGAALLGLQEAPSSRAPLSPPPCPTGSLVATRPPACPLSPLLPFAHLEHLRRNAIASSSAYRTTATVATTRAAAAAAAEPDTAPRTAATAANAAAGNAAAGAGSYAVRTALGGSSSSSSGNGQLQKCASETCFDLDPPEHFLGPITTELMRDPVFAMDGFTYERRAIEAWLERSDTSPMTGAVLDSKRLVPNHNLRSFIKSWREEHLRSVPAGKF